MTRTALISGGAGYIGSHACIHFLEAGWKVVVIDNLYNGSVVALRRAEDIAGGNIVFIEGDVRDLSVVRSCFSDTAPDLVVHLSGVKSVSESNKIPLDYYEINVGGMINILRAMEEFGCPAILFSSSATVYGEPTKVPISETERIAPTNPYGRSKEMAENIIFDFVAANPRISAGVLRYFNPVGAHPSGRIGEDPIGEPSNLFPCIAQVLVGRLPKLKVLGDDWPTIDRTGVRDYIHVMDLVRGHLATAEYLLNHAETRVFNLGTGAGVTVMQAVRRFEKHAGARVPLEIVERRAGDVPALVADPSLAERVLGWKAIYDLDDMCRDHYRWQKANPNGYR